MLGCSSLIDKHLHLRFVFTIFWQKKNGKHQCENGFFYTVFCLLMVLESPKPTKSKTQVSMAHVPTTKSRT